MKMSVYDAADAWNCTANMISTALKNAGVTSESRSDIVKLLKDKHSHKKYFGRIRNKFVPFRAILDVFATKKKDFLADATFQRAGDMIEEAAQEPEEEEEDEPMEEDSSSVQSSDEEDQPAPAPIPPPTSPLEETIQQIQQDMESVISAALKQYTKSPQWRERVSTLATAEAKNVATRMKDEYDNAKALHQKRLLDLEASYNIQEAVMKHRISQEQQKRTRKDEAEDIDLTSARTLLKDI
jgi:hypothetical protein